MVLRKKLVIIKVVKIFRILYKVNSSLHLQSSATGRYFEPQESSPWLHTLFLVSRFNVQRQYFIIRPPSEKHKTKQVHDLLWSTQLAFQSRLITSLVHKGMSLFSKQTFSNF
jgi:hypothetical protein